MTIERALRTETLDHEGAALTVDVHGGPAGPHRPLMVIGSPMGADGFTDLVGHITDRMVITYDPRGPPAAPRARRPGRSRPHGTPPISRRSSGPWTSARWTCSPPAAAP